MKIGPKVWPNHTLLQRPRYSAILAAGKPIGLKYDVMRVCMEVDVAEVDETRGLEVLKVLDVDGLLLPEVGLEDLLIWLRSKRILLVLPANIRYKSSTVR